MFLLPASAQAPEAELTAVFQTLEAVLDTAREIESYRMLHGRLPKASSPAELSQAMVGSDSRAAEMVDGWGTPLVVESDPASNEYTVASAGSDRKLERAQWAQRAETRSASADIVLRNREFMRWPEKWAVAQLEALSGKPDPSRGDALERERALRTIADLMVVKTALESYAEERGTMPAATDINVLASILESFHGTSIPRTDGWGTAFGVMVNPDAKMYRLVAAGADQRFDVSGWEDTETVRDFNRDLVLFNGDFVGRWETGATPGAAGQALASLSGAKNMWQAMLDMSAEERRTQRLSGLKSDMEDAVRRGDVVAAIGFYEEYQTEDPSFHDASLLWPLEFAFSVPPPQSLGRPRATDDPAQQAAIPRIEAAVQRALRADPHDWLATFTSSRLVLLRGDAAGARRILADYAEKHPAHLQSLLELAQLAIDAKEWERAVAESGRVEARVANSDDPEILAEAALVTQLILADARTEGMPEAGRMAIVARGAAIARRALERKPGYGPAMHTLANLLDEQASLESNAAKKARLSEEAERLKIQALELMKELQRR